jgi:hypothetical protein
MKLETLTAVALSALLLSSCATKFTPEQRAALATVSVAPTEVPGDAYSEPYGGDRAGAANAGMIGVTSGTGALGGVVGSLVGETIAATQDNAYRSSNKEKFAAVQKNTPQVGPIMTSNLKKGMKNDGFFGSRLRDDSPNLVTSKVTSYRLMRSGKNDDGELLFSPQIVVEIQLKDGTGKSLAGGTYTGSGYPNITSVYAGSAAKTKEGYEFAAKTAADAFSATLAQKLAD